MRRNIKKITSAIVLFSMMCSIGLPFSGIKGKAETVANNQENSAQEFNIAGAYSEYLLQHKDAASGSDNLTFTADSFSESIGEVEKITDTTKTAGVAGAVYTGEDSSISWEVTISESGMYNVFMNYLPAEGNGNDIERNIYIDGEIPYSEAQFITFTRVYMEADEIKQDANGNDIRPQQVETPQWRGVYLYDASRYYNDPLQFYLEKGTHVITIEAVREPMYIGEVKVCKAQELSTYAQKKAEYESQGYKSATADPIKIQAEDMYQKSDYTLYPVADRSSSITEPQDPAKVKLNCISGDKYKLPGQWISWKVNVPEDGLYQIALRYKQSILSGLYSSRTLRIDGEIPFEEAKNFNFTYDSEWKMDALGDETEDFMFYLTAGEHEISMEVTLGDLASVIAQVNDSLLELNEIYRNVLLIVGAEPDIYRDYNFERQIPQIIELIGQQATAVDKITKELEGLVGKKGEQTVILDKLSHQLSRMYKDPTAIASNFTAFKDNIGNLASWILTISQQPLSIDYLYLAPVEEKLPKAEAGFFKAAWYEIKSFVMSFFVDYNSLGLTSEVEKDDLTTIEVWITSGRDQANILRQMINDSFTPDSDINVELKLVSPGTLLPSVLAGEGPDVSLGNPMGDPIQYAIRNAVMNLDDLKGFDEVKERFHESSLVSYEFDGDVYGLPETQTFPMMFYRKDIFNELGLSVPQTWEDFYEVIAVLQRNNLEIGFPQGLPGTQIFLYQNGGSLYNKGLTASTLNNDSTIDAFQQMIELFTTYKFPRDYNFSNRFRTGQMPLAIQDYTEYNTLVAFAPEIKGLWGFAPIPGTMMEDGTIDRAAACNGTCAMILKGTEEKDASFEFLTWWTEAATQARFAQEMKSVLGKAAMYATANMEAIQSLPWTKEEYSNLLEQWNYITGTPEIPGGYYVSRNVGFAANAAYNNGDGDILLEYAKDTNEEITRKRAEFGLE
ncbi:MAG: hypothetical protein K0S47_1798 [Herbinix sp.]|jgi:ABC-type glycerol-3-phosphate transport system substrate-binding protein|nr:hypothetical protein [Herbinix sp.]